MKGDVRLLLQAGDAAFRPEDREAARAKLRRGISQAKHCYKALHVL